MKKIISLVLILVIVLTFSLTGCSNTRKLYNYDLSKYVKLGDYKVAVDTESKEYKEYFEEFDQSFADLLRKEVTVGTVKEGDTVNIDYKGFLNGEAFDGGTGEDFDLKIGSNTFIDGFEEGLIGCEIGSTVDIKATFPKDYGVEELNGQETTFTVTLNALIQTDSVNTSNVKTIGYNSFEEYIKAKKEYAVLNTAWDIIYKDADITEYPEKEMDIIFEDTVNFLERACSLNSITLEQFISYNNMTTESFNNYIKENEVRLSVYSDLISYYILDKENYEITDQDLKDALKDLEEENGIKNDKIDYPKSMIEQRAAYIAAKRIVLDNATVK